MSQRFYLLLELLYGVALLTAIAAAPDIEIKLRPRYDEKLSITYDLRITYGFPDIGTTMIKALLVTFLAMMPTVTMLPQRLTKWRLFKFVPLAPWILMCCVKFPQHVIRHIFTIRHTAEYMNTFPLSMVLAIYIIFFVMAIELAWHWIVYAHMCISGYVMVK
ncbi:hypothetical protein KR059_002896 [Drosophila kikkawai]|nr:hypothetical protein KR059_002896 [Drosophila kikkawai]